MLGHRVVEGKKKGSPLRNGEGVAHGVYIKIVLVKFVLLSMGQLLGDLHKGFLRRSTYENDGRTKNCLVLCLMSTDARKLQSEEWTKTLAPLPTLSYSPRG